MIIAIAFTGWFVVVVPLRADILDNDLTLIYIGARIGLEHGWSHMYSVALQRELFTQLRPHAVFNAGVLVASPPPYSWLVLPLSLFGAAGSTYAWLAISLAALMAAWWLTAPGAMPFRALWLLGALAWYPLLYGLSLAQPDLVILALAAIAWRLAEANRPYLAGIVLGLSVIKPQLLLILPVVLLCAGRWKIAVAWATTALVLAVASLAAIGQQGLNDYLSLLQQLDHDANNRYFTLAFLLGPGILSYAAQVAVAAAAAVAGFLNRHNGDARIFALGIVATALGATYWHLQDFTILLLAVWLFWRESPSIPLRLLLLVIAIAGEFAWPLTPLPILLGVAVWFAAMFTSPRKSPAVAD